jgi:hypothetical protein
MSELKFTKWQTLLGRIGRRYWIARIDRALSRAWEQGLIDSWLVHELDGRMKYAKCLDIPYPPRPPREARK